MENLFLYLAKVCGLIILFSASYHLFLKKETFFNSIRFYLISGIITSFILPLFTLTKIVWVDPAPVFDAAADNLTVSSLPATLPAAEQPFEVNWWYVAGAIYLIGTAFFLLRFIADIYKVSSILKTQNIINEDGFKMIDTNNNISPFSFFRYIVFTSSALTTQELNDIIAHEKIHSSQLHSLDMIISQLGCIILWFNPFIWLYKKQIAQNLEFIADAQATKTVSDVVAYQKTLLKITLQPQCIAITNHFYQSLIKKRIIMLNKKQSKKLNFTKFGVILPALAGFMYFFQTETIAQERADDSTVYADAGHEEPAVQAHKETSPIDATVRVDKNLSNAVMKERKTMFKDIFNAELIFKNIKRNKQGLITAITVMVKDKDHSLNYPVYEITSDDDTPIEPFNVTIKKAEESGKNDISFEKIESRGAKTVEKVPGEKNQENKTGAVEYIKSRMKDRDVIVVINGVIKNEGDILPPAGEKFDEIIELDAASTLKKYNVKAKDGAIVLTTKKIENIDNVQTATNSSVLGTKSASSNIFTTTIGTNAIENIRTNNSRLVTVTTMYDKEGKEIVNHTADNTYFIINSTTTDIQLNAYKEDLEKVGIKVEYSDIKRNSIGKIISIKINLLDKKANSKASGSWDIKKKDNAIPDIYIGKIKNKLVVSATE